MARRAGVSASTVSRILNGSAKVAADKRQAVEDAIQELNFRPNLMAQYLKTGQSMTLGVLTQHVESPFSNEMLRGVEHTLQGMEYVPLIVSGHWNAEEEVERLRLLVARRVDGLIILTGHVNQQTLLEFSQQIPIVATGHNIMTERVHSFSINNRLGGYMATRYLLDLGHHDIAHIVGLPDQNDAIERHHGYRQALVSAGIEYDPSLVIQGDFAEAGGLNAVKKLVQSGRKFSAIFCANDQTCYGAILGLKQCGLRVPEDVSLIGFDDLPFSTYSNPPLTTVRQPIYEMGVKMVKTLLGLIEGTEPNSDELPELSIVVRDTTLPYKG
ncbi:LacI family DNA-binding transcriptional regulator [Aeromonas veronii]|uniref:LacI family DNA-binding transcriptional regulator n=1 Tax=Aeromonas veronii TaxID=654 RepID=A0AAN1QIY3_AERVE|nr:transcriptional regulator [Aeromonas veronii]TNI83134.1 transcriptional regulator [Aeromonas sobria]AYV39288.1 LacI family DNA-binding transcriptional regulator [Aeromonas veronii]EKP0293760.1 LacI family DNA-binding transcriptional regulator [Aeromonas veronii]EKP0313193.1 LacI family DNA-binding transcriptional regulator [Aeromonas veronii]